MPAPRADGDLLDQLRGAVGHQYVVTDDLDRVVHTYGKGLRDLVRVRAGDLPKVPDAVVYPATEEQVRAIVDLAVAADAVVIPFGGGSNISGSLTPEPQEQRTVLSVDLGRMNRVLEIDEGSALARIQAGVLGPDMEAQLNARGWTLGHQPDSFKHSTLGGWIATRSSGMQSDKYGDIARSPAACGWRSRGRCWPCGHCPRPPPAPACARWSWARRGGSASSPRPG